MAYTAQGVDPVDVPALAEVEKTTGPSNFFRFMAHHPAAMEHFADFYQIVMGPGAVDHRLKEMLYLAVSTVNECRYCTAHHVKSGKAAGLNNEEIQEIETEQGQNFTPAEQAALHYARELTRTASVDDEVRFRIQEHFTNDQFVEITLVISLANFTNRFNNGMAVPLESDLLSRKL